MQNKRCLIYLTLILLLFSFVGGGGFAHAENEPEYIITNLYDGSTVNTGKDNGYSGSTPITEDKDLHFGWSLGSFILKGYTEVMQEDSIPVFLVNPDDSITLSFKLKQNIDRLNNDDKLIINEDKNGYDAAFHIEKTNFGRGALFVKFTDHLGKSRVIPRLDYLTGVQGQKANVKAINLEEGDYEIALDYEIAHKRLPLTTYHNYRTTAKFKIRNSSCLLYLLDNKTNNFLPNYSVAENGFYLKYTSFYQRIVTKCEVLTNNGKGYTLTPVECKAAKNEQSYTDPGIYTITVKNVYTNESVDMVIAVGKDAITNSFVTSKYEFTPDQIAELIDNGQAEITDDWLIKVTENPKPEKTPSVEQTNPPTESNDESKSIPLNTNILIICCSVILVAIVGFIIVNNKKKRKKQKLAESKAKFDSINQQIEEDRQKAIEIETVLDEQASEGENP